MLKSTKKYIADVSKMVLRTFRWCRENDKI
nr:MAG TPA: hypothetical protein [Caudoviricetes sp.]